MKFSELPQPVRKDIIDLIIRDDPKYCQLNKEWLLPVVNLHGKIFLGRERIDQDVRTIPYSKYVGYIWFGRIVDIDWDRILNFKSLQEVEFDIHEEHSEEVWREFKNELLSLPILSKISINTCSDELVFYITEFLNIQHQVKELKIPPKHFNQYFNSNHSYFSNLTNLTLTSLDSTFDINQITKCVPKLKRLSIDSYSQYEYRLFFGDCVIPTVKELTIHYFQNDIYIKLDLSKWTSLDKLDSDCTIEFTNLNDLVHLKDLSLMGSDKYLADVMSTKFTNLRILILEWQDNPNLDTILKIFQSCHSVTILELKIYDELELPDNLPVSPYAVTNLYLNGPFLLTSSLLNWLSDQFHLITLRLKHCPLYDHQLTIFPFTTLDRLFILTEDILEYRRQFNKRSYPHIRSIIIGRACGFHDGASEIYLDSIIHANDSPELNRMFYGYHHNI